MSKLKPWYKVVTPREDLREGKPLDASDVEISEDMFIITSEEAEKHVKPPELAKII